MKKSHIITVGVFAVIGAWVFYYFKKNKIQVTSNVYIEKKIDEAVKEIASINKAVEDKKNEEEALKSKQKIEETSKEAEDYIGKTLLIAKLNGLNKIYNLRDTKNSMVDIKKLKEEIGYSTKSPVLTQIRDVQNLLKEKYAIYPDSQGIYSI